MTTRRLWKPLAAVALGLPVIAAAGYWALSRVKENAIWRELQRRVPAGPMVAGEHSITYDNLTATTIPSGDEVGHIRLANGEIWRFAFRSHHHLGGLDSYSVFAGPAGAFRVRGQSYCCEVDPPPAEAARDGASFLAYLRVVNSSVEPVR